MRLHLILFLVVYFVYEANSQNTHEDIIIYLDTNKPLNFYEAQLISFDYIIENTSKVKKKYHIEPVTRVTKIWESSGKEIEKKDLFSQLHYYKPREDDFSEIEADSFPSHYKLKRSSTVSPRLFGNIHLKDFLNIPDSIYNFYPFKPLFFKQGEYIAEITCILVPYKNKIRLTVPFRIIKAEGKVKDEQHKFLTSLNELILQDNVLRSNEQEEVLDSFFTLLKTSPQSPFSSMVFYLLIFNSKLYNQLRFQRNPQYIYSLFELIPNIGSQIPKSNLASFYTLFTYMVKMFQEEGYIKNQKDYLNSYLEKIKHLDPSLSDIIIFEAKKNSIY